MSYISQIEVIEGRQVLCAGTASPSDLDFPIKELAGRSVSWAIDGAPVADAVARTPTGGIVIECANAGVADDWYFAIRRANGENVRHESWRPDPPDCEAALLAVIYDWLVEGARAHGRGPEDVAFDASSLKFAACDYPQILDALAFLKPTQHRRYYGICLDEASRKRIDKWLWKMDGQTRGGYRLWRGEYGWAHIARVGP